MKKSSITKIASSTLPTKYGTFAISVYKCGVSDLEHVALVHGNVRGTAALVRVHSQCLTGDTFGSLRCDCQAQLHESIRIIQKAESGIIIYLNQEGRGIGLGNKIKAYALQDRGYDTVEANHALGFPADARGYEIAALMLKDLGVEKIKLLTNNPDKEKQLTQYGIKILKRVPLEIKHNEINATYLSTKKRKMGHRLTKI